MYGFAIKGYEHIPQFNTMDKALAAVHNFFPNLEEEELPTGAVLLWKNGINVGIVAPILEVPGR